MEIVFDHVSKKIGKKTVIDEANFVIKSNTVVGLKGTNGSGKTMIMRLIAGMIYASSGSVKIDHKILGKDMAFPGNLGMMLETPAFLGKYSGYDNLRMLADIKGIINEKNIQEVMEKVGLAGTGKMKYKEFSLGMKQRLGIACAIMEQPDILLLDEPTNALDEDGVVMIKNIVKEQRERGATIVIASHEGEVLKSMADEIIEVSQGRIKDVHDIK